MTFTFYNMTLPLSLQNLSDHQSILLSGLQHVILYLQCPILLYHDGHHDVDLIVQNLSESHSMFVTTVPATPYRADLVKPQSTVFVARNPKIVDFNFRKWDLWNARGKILVILNDPENVQEWITQLWVTTKAVDVMVMVVNETVSFFTWFPYREKECVNVTTISKLEPPHLFPDKIVPPLHDCPLLATTGVLPPFVVDDDHGLEPKLFHVLAEKVGLKAKFVDLPVGQYVWSLFDDKGEPMNALKRLWKNEIDMMFSALGPNFVSGVADSLPPHYKEQVVWFVPGPKVASKSTAMYRAFSYQMWILVLISFILLLATLAAATFFNGSALLASFFTTLAINLSISSKLVKSQRFLVFIAFAYLYSLHITTAYQSSLMVFFSDVPREKAIQTLQDLEMANLDIMLHPQHKSFAEPLAQTLAYKEILRPDKVTYFDYFHLDSIVESGKLAMLGPYCAFGYVLTSKPKYFYDENGFPKILILKDLVVVSSDVSFLMPKGHPLVPLFSKYVLHLSASGIPEKFIREQISQAPQSVRNKEPFGMDEIEGPFYLFLGLLLLSLLVWITEFLIGYFQQKILHQGTDKNPRKPKTIFFNYR